MEPSAASPTCGTCNEAVPAKARFCPFCGARQTEHDALKREEGGEHRQITVMFCDVAGSTSLSSRLHSEDLRELLRDYQAICADAIESRGGMIAQYLGDGIMAYFGYPRAHEDAAIRAADAAIEICRKAQALGEPVMEKHGVEFAVRLALHTGRVLIGTMGAGVRQEHHSVTGVVPNMTARIEGFAPSNGVAVSAETKALIASTFRMQSIGLKDLKGIPEPVEIFHVLGRKPATSVLPDVARMPVGREGEVATLMSAWERVEVQGSARLVISAEAGAGKSVLASCFLKDACIPRAQILEFAGSIAGRHTPFASLRETLERWVRTDGNGHSDELVQRIAGWFDQESMGDAIHVNVLKSLLDGTIEDGTAGRQAVFAAATALVDRLPSPLVVVIEDAHWIDHSTLELMDRISADESARIFLLVLARPEFEADWSDPRQTEITLGGLSSKSASALVEQVAGGPVEAAVIRQIIDATNGLPLYVEELTKSLIESGQIARERNMFRSASVSGQALTPPSLLDLITSRLDMLGDAKLFAQICAVLGRDFDRAALLEVSGVAPDTIDAAVTALSIAGILSVARGGRLSFRHALYQSAAYESIVRRARLTWHERYLRWLEKNPKRLSATRPENIGYHMEACGRLSEAVDAYMQAGLGANRTSASHEAAAHFQKAADLLVEIGQRDADGPDLQEKRLNVQVLLAGALLSARGPGARETRSAYDIAIGLAEATPESEHHFPAYWGWWRVSDSFATMAERAKRLQAVSNRMDGAEFKLQAKHCVWANAFQMGELTQSIETAREGLVMYQDGGFEGHGTLYGGHDCKVCALGEIGLASWLQGAGDAATIHCDSALAHAERLGHLGSLLHALDIAIMLHHYRRDPVTVARLATRLHGLATERDLEDYRAKAEIFQGWAQIAQGDIEDGLAQVDEGFRVMQEVGTPEDFPVYQCIRSQAMRRMSRLDEALNALYDGRAVIDDEGVNYWGAEIARNEVEVELARPEPVADFVRTRLNEARQLAKAQGALALELRAAMTGLRWGLAGGDAERRRADLVAVLRRFDANAAGHDLDEARRLLAETP
ncbi:MAG: adenylate/guanylate cyclase domain-containing protein [Paracoccaceae bacterium]